MFANVLAVLARVAPVAVNGNDSSANFAQLLNDHALQPGARIAQVVVVLMAIFDAMGSAAAHHQDHWLLALVRPVGLGVVGVGVIEVFKIAANGVLSGTLGF